MPAPEWYHDFVDASHRPAATDVIARFRFDAAAGISTEEAVGRIASESSCGTWTTLAKLPRRLAGLKAMGYDYDPHHCLVAYPRGLWEPGNMPQLLSGVAGNIFGMKAVRNLRLVDLRLPRWFLSSFRGPQYGIPGLRRLLRVPDRPLTATVPKPKLGYSAKEHAELAFEVWAGGVDLVKDDENLTDQSFNRFEDRVTRMAHLRGKAEHETGDRKSALLNITAETREMERRAKLIAGLGWEYAMVDVVTVGTAGVQTIRDVAEDLGLALHAHRAMHAMFTKNPKHGMAMPCLAKVMRVLGVDQIHAGTVVGKLESPAAEVHASMATCRERRVKGDGAWLLPQDWGSMAPIFPVASGGLHPGLLWDIHRIFGSDVVVQVGGGVLGHPKGPRAGAAAVRQAIEAALAGIAFKDAAAKSVELRAAYEKWGKVRPR